MTLEQKVKEVTGLLARIRDEYSPAIFASSLSAEDMVLTDFIAKEFREIEMFTIDTGRLPQETHNLLRAVATRYGLNIRVYFPGSAALEQFVSHHGSNAFYDSVELRKRCCELRKVVPLARALDGKRAWITGMRRQQSALRAQVAVFEFDQGNALYKFNPLADWSDSEVWDYIRQHDVPYNALYERGYASIGCAPCTRAITAGEHIRAGRWWWEAVQGGECGLHRGGPKAERARGAVSP
jgi:phosphoadenosine phosphosulfate reductase